MSDDIIRQEAAAAREMLAQAAKPQAQPANTPVEAKEKEVGARSPKVASLPATGLTVSAAQGGNPEPDEAKRLAAELQKHKVEEGRLRKVSEELAQKQKENEELKARLAQLDRVGASERIRNFVDPERLKVIDEDVLSGTVEMVNGGMSELEKRLRAEIEEVKARVESGNQSSTVAANRAFDMSIDQAFPGFIAQTTAGGENHQAWTKFLASEDPATGLPYESSIQGAYGRHHIGGVSRVINDFLNDAGITRREARNDTVQPAGSVSGQGGPAASGDTKIYTESEMNAALKKSRSDFERGLIDRKTRVGIVEKYQTAITEGRVVQG